MNDRRRITGVVTSNKMEKTVVVEISRTFRHQLYKKVVHTSKKVMAHDEKGCQIGDQVIIVESRPCRAESAGWWRKFCVVILLLQNRSWRLNHDPARISVKGCR